jgi:O-antigen/teichoic acid export membrane protein
LFTTREFITGAPLIGLLAPALLLSQMYIFAPGIIIAKKTHLQLWIMLFYAFVSIVGNYFLVQRWGILGAATATLLASSLFFSCWVFFSQMLYRIPYEWRKLKLFLLTFSICMLLGFGFDYLAVSFPINFILKICLLLILIVVLSRSLPISKVHNFLLQFYRG